MVICTLAEPVREPEAVEEAVSAWVPRTRSLREKEEPVPIWPMRLLVHTRPALRSPSCTSEELPVKVMGEPLVKLELLVGEEMVTLGGLLLPPPPRAACALTTPPVT